MKLPHIRIGNESTNTSLRMQGRDGVGFKRLIACMIAVNVMYAARELGRYQNAEVQECWEPLEKSEELYKLYVDRWIES